MTPAPTTPRDLREAFDNYAAADRRCGEAMVEHARDFTADWEAMVEAIRENAR